MHGLLYCRDLGLRYSPFNTSCAQAYTLQQKAIATGAENVVVLICKPRQAQTHLRWAAAERPRMNICSQHIIQVLYGCHALPCTLSLHAAALLMQAYPALRPAGNISLHYQCLTEHKCGVVSCRSHATVAVAVHLCKETLQPHAKTDACCRLQVGNLKPESNQQNASPFLDLCKTCESTIVISWL